MCNSSRPAWEEAAREPRLTVWEPLVYPIILEALMHDIDKKGHTDMFALQQ